jgi:hypothetical protein
MDDGFNIYVTICNIDKLIFFRLSFEICMIFAILFSLYGLMIQSN